MWGVLLSRADSPPPTFQQLIPKMLGNVEISLGELLAEPTAASRHGRCSLGRRRRGGPVRDPHSGHCRLCSPPAKETTVSPVKGGEEGARCEPRAGSGEERRGTLEPGGKQSWGGGAGHRGKAGVWTDGSILGSLRAPCPARASGAWTMPGRDPPPDRLPSFSVQRDASASTSPLGSATPGSPTNPARWTLGANLQAGVRLNYERLGGFYRRSIARVTGTQLCQKVFASCCRTFQPSLLPSKCHFQLLRTICS